MLASVKTYLEIGQTFFRFYSFSGAFSFSFLSFSSEGLEGIFNRGSAYVRQLPDYGATGCADDTDWKEKCSSGENIQTLHPCDPRHLRLSPEISCSRILASYRLAQSRMCPVGCVGTIY